MSSAAEKAAARRARILAKGSERMNLVTGVPAASSNNDATNGAPPATALSTADADAALDAALNAMNEPAPSAAAPAAASTTAGADDDDDDVLELDTSTALAADPHEFPSSDEVAASRVSAQSMNPFGGGMPFGASFGAGMSGGDAQDPFAAFARAAQMMGGQPGGGSFQSAAERRRNKDAAAAAALTQELDLPQRSPLQRLAVRVKHNLRETPSVRLAATLATVCVAVLSGLGTLEGGLGWLMMVEVLVYSANFAMDSVNSKRKAARKAGSTSAAAAAASRPTPAASPFAAPAADGDELELDTDQYALANRANANSGFPQMQGFPDLNALLGGGASGGRGGLSKMLGMPPAVDTALSALSLLLKYATVMRQLLNDAMLFLFVTVVTNAVLQLINGRETFVVQ